MTDTASLQIRVTSGGIEDADRKLSRLERQGRRAERATDGLGRAFTRLVAPVTAVVSVSAGLQKLVSVTRGFEVLNAQLKTATGSAAGAAEAFTHIQDFATQTPYDLQQATAAFTQLVNYGLTPSREALTSYGNTASALGKDLSQMVEAVADATTGEFERLKEFGIRAKNQGDTVAFTFRGVTTTVKNNAQEIERYLIDLGENNFAGAMAERMDTLDGALSNLGDEWDKLFLNISEQGVGDVIEDSVRLGIEALEELNAMLASGELTAYLDAIAGKFDGWGEDIAATMDIVGQLAQDHFGQWGDKADSAVDSVIDAFVDLPENVRAAVQLMAVEFAALIDYGKAYGKAFGQVIGVELAALVDKAGIYGKELADRLNPFDGDTFDYGAELARSTAIASEMTDSYFREAERQADITRQARIASIEAVLLERDSAVGSFDKQIAGAKDLRAEYERLQAERKKATEGQDSLAKFKVQPSGGSTGETDPATSRLAERQQREFDNLVASLRTEEEAVQDSYDRRLQIILQNTEEGSRQQQDLVNRLNQDFATQVLEGFQAEPATFDAKEAALQEEYERRRQIILDNTRLTEEQRTELELQLTQERNEQLAALEAQKNQQMLSNASQVFDGLAGIAKSASGEQSDAYRALFAVSKAFSVTQAAMSIATGLARAQELGFPANLAEMARVAASGASILATIRGSNFSGAYDRGGMIPAGKIGIVGEYGPELVSGPATVTSRRTTADSPNQGVNSQPQAPAPSQNNIRIINSIDPGVMEDYLGSSAGEEVIMNVIRKNPETLRAVSGS